MGYWEQIGEENRAWRARRARMHPFRRALGDVLTYAFVIAGTVFLYAMMLAPLWQPALARLGR
jgi:hypothetical protein